MKSRSLKLLVMVALVMGGLVVPPVAAVAQAEPVLLSREAPATASSVESAAFPAAAAVDGDLGTRWSSQWSDPQWLQVDLGQTAAVSEVVLVWETAFATSYQVQVSDDAAIWQTAFATDAGAGGREELTVSASGRYVRVFGTQRGTGWGYSLWELEVYGTTEGQPPEPIPETDPHNPDFGPNTFVYGPSTPVGEIQGRLDAIAAEMRTNQFGSQRYAVLLEPGSYNLDADLRFYTQIAGLGLLPDDVTINGHVRVEADWLSQGGNPNNLGNATQNFWRSAENLAVTLPAGQIERWAVSQAAPYRRMHLRGLEMQLWNGADGWASGGLIADSKIEGTVVSGSQQQFLTRNSELDGGWAGSVWNMVFTGTTGSPPPHFPDPSHTVVDHTPAIREKPFLYLDETTGYRVFVPALRENARGTSWSSGAPAGTSISLSEFYVVTPGTGAATINAALAQDRHLLITPGVYQLAEPIRVTRPDTVVLGLGIATLVPTTGQPAVTVADVDGVKLAGLLIDAGQAGSPVLLEVGPPGSSQRHAANPTSLHDVFLRVGGAHAGSASVSVQINSHDVIGDHLWLWRGDHGTGIGWDLNTAANGLVVNGDHVTMHGLFVEHYQEHNVLWNGNGGRTYFFQNEMPYDPPAQQSWSSGGGTLGWASYKVADQVSTHEAWGVGSYCFFNVNPSVVASRAFEVPDAPGVQFHNLVTVSLGGVGTITHVVNDTGAAVNPDNLVSYLVSYP